MSNNDDVATNMYRLVSAIREGRLSNIPLHYRQSPAAVAAIPPVLATAPATADSRCKRIRELLDNNRALIERICGNKQPEKVASNSNVSPADPRVKVRLHGCSQRANEALPGQSARPATQTYPTTSARTSAIEDAHAAVASTSSKHSSSGLHDTAAERCLEVEAGEGWPDTMPASIPLRAANPDGPLTEEWPLRICDIDRSARTKPPLDGNPLLESLSRRFLFIPEATSGKPPKLPRAIPLARGTLVNNEWMFPTKWDHVLAECEFWKQQHDRLKAEHAGATVELSTLHGDLEEKASCFSKNDNLRNLRDTYNQTRTLLDAKTLEANRLVSAMSKLRDELTVEQRLSAQRNELNAVLERKQETLKSEIQEEQSKRRKAEEENQALRDQLENSKLTKPELKDEATQTDRPAGPSPTVQKAKEQFALLRKQNTSLRAEVDELIDKSDRLSSDNNELRKSVEELTTKIEALVQANVDLEATNMSQSLKADEMNRAIGAYKDQISRQFDLVHQLTIIVNNRATALRERACFQCAEKTLDTTGLPTSGRYAQTPAVLAVSEPTPEEASTTSPMSDIKNSMKELISLATSTARSDLFGPSVPSGSPSEVENPTLTPSNEQAENSSKRSLESEQAIPPAPKKPRVTKKKTKNPPAATTSDGTALPEPRMPHSQSAGPLTRMEDLVSHVLGSTATSHVPMPGSASSMGQPVGITTASPRMPYPSTPNAMSIPVSAQPSQVPGQQPMVRMIPPHAVRASMVPQQEIRAMYAAPPGYAYVMRGPAPQYHPGSATPMQLHQAQPVLQPAQDQHMRGFIATNAAKGLGYQSMRDALVKNFPGNQSILHAFEHSWQASFHQV